MTLQKALLFGFITTLQSGLRPSFAHNLHMYVVRINLSYTSGGTYSLILTPNVRFLSNFFMADFFTLRIFVRNLLRNSSRRNIFIISFC